MQDWREEFNKRFTFDANKGSGDNGDLEVAAPRTNEIKTFISELLERRDQQWRLAIKNSRLWTDDELVRIRENIKDVGL